MTKTHEGNAEAARNGRAIDRKVTQRKQRLAMIKQEKQQAEEQRQRMLAIGTSPSPLHQSQPLPEKTETITKPKLVFEKKDGYQKPRRIFNSVE